MFANTLLRIRGLPRRNRSEHAYFNEPLRHTDVRQLNSTSSSVSWLCSLIKRLFLRFKEMGGADEDNTSKKPVNSYALLQMKMNEIEKTKKPKAPSSSNSKSDPNFSSTKSSFSSKSFLDKSPKRPPVKKEFASDKKNMDPNVPDRSYGDFYCPTCDSHMNSDAMWEAHITGKRHIKNVKKGDPDPKYEELDVESTIKYEIRNVKDPIVGLSYIHEIRRKEVGAPSLYTCFLCQANFPTVPLVIEHVIGMKHRLNFIRENSENDYQLLEATNLKKGQMEPLVEECALKLEQKFGRGSVTVKQERIRQPAFPPASKRAFDYDDDDDEDDDLPRKPKSQKHDEKNLSVWKSVDFEKRSSIKDIRDCREILNEKRRYAYSSDEEIDMRKREDFVKRPVYDKHSSHYKSSQAPRESIKVTTYTRMPTRAPSEERYRHSRSPPRESLKKEIFNPKSPPYAPPDDQLYHSRSYQVQEKDSGSSKDYPSTTKSKVQQSESDNDMLVEFLQKIYALPTEMFLKVILLKLERLEIKGIDELTVLSQVIKKAQVVLCNKLPPDVQAVLKQKMSQNSESSVQSSSAVPTVLSQTVSNPYNTDTNFKPPGPQLPGSDFNFMKDIITKRSVESSSSSSSQNMIPHQASPQNMIPHQASQPNVMSYQSPLYGNINSFQNGNQPPSTMGSSYNSAPPSSSYNSAPPSSSYYNSPPPSSSYNSALPSSTSGIPGLTLTEETQCRDAQPPYNAYQPRYPDPSSSYPPYQY